MNPKISTHLPDLRFFGPHYFGTPQHRLLPSSFLCWLPPGGLQALPTEGQGGGPGQEVQAQEGMRGVPTQVASHPDPTILFLRPCFRKGGKGCELF